MLICVFFTSSFWSSKCPCQLLSSALSPVLCVSYGTHIPFTTALITMSTVHFQTLGTNDPCHTLFLDLFRPPKLCAWFVVLISPWQCFKKCGVLINCCGWGRGNCGQLKHFKGVLTEIEWVLTLLYFEEM